MVFRSKGPLSAWRIANARYSVFDGAGAAEHGARWNSTGRMVIYAAEHYATAMLENLVHFNTGRLPRQTLAVAIRIPDDLEIEVAASDDVAGWRDADCAASRCFGDAWYDEGMRGERPAALLVPAIIAPRHERNVLINQRHPLFPRIRADAPEAVELDPRLLATRRS